MQASPFALLVAIGADDQQPFVPSHILALDQRLLGAYHHKAMCHIQAGVRGATIARLVCGQEDRRRFGPFAQPLIQE